MPDIKRPNGNGNGNGGTINERTKLPLSFVIPLVVCVASAALAYTSQLRAQEDYRRETKQAIEAIRKEITKHELEDRFRGADGDRWSERIQWAWEFFARKSGMESYPVVPPWREGTPYHPQLIYIEEEESN